MRALLPLAVIVAALLAASAGAAPHTDPGVTSSSILIGGTVPLSGPNAALSLPGLAPGTYQVFASYSGDPLYRPSNSPVVTLVVTPAPMSTAGPEWATATWCPENSRNFCKVSATSR